MQNILKLTSEIELVGTLKLLAHVYEEVSVMRMQKVRQSVLSTRNFLDKLSFVFGDVKQSYKAEISRLLEKKNQSKTSFGFSTLENNQKTAVVYISANARLYGDIINKVFNSFYEDIQKNKTDDIFVIGSLGKSLLVAKDFKRDFKYFEIPDFGVTLDHIKPIVTALLNYSQVRVYYGRFQNVLTQESVTSDVTGEHSLDADSENPGQKVSFYFEPALEEVLNFFQNQVFASLFKQTIHETELARFASRIKAMENALGNIEQKETGLLQRKRQLKKLIDNKKMMESIAGINLWR